ncbi:MULTISPECIES: hypothetical protein [unclassified Legionella]|uniref:hypothetical protein n=1 Tax=unclassified Legionella TaxID=2622702 RepID=UPI001055781B|nr:MULTISPECIES: hypothetical protein [unclassified Legionella]MDI9818174.1 hypothetical protein [Legionella sp. PL877]
MQHYVAYAKGKNENFDDFEFIINDTLLDSPSPAGYIANAFANTARNHYIANMDAHSNPPPAQSNEYPPQDSVTLEGNNEQEPMKPCLESSLLFNAFNSYQSERKLTHSKVKNEVLKNLKSALENCNTIDDVNEVQEQFKKEYQQLNHHRFTIWSNDKTRSATVFDNMIEKRTEQLQLIISSAKV